MSIISKFQLPSNYGLGLEDSEQKDDSINEIMNEEGVYRTAPATPGLLINRLLGNFVGVFF